MSKKVLIRYSPGASGRFIGHLIDAMVNPVPMLNCSHTHSANYNPFQYNNLSQIQFERLNDDQLMFSKFESVKNIVRDTIKFTDCIRTSTLNIMWTHVDDVGPILSAIPDCVLVNVTVEETDIDQVCFNFVTKILNKGNQYDQLVRSAQKHKFYGLLKHVDYNDMKVMSCLRKYTHINESQISYKQFNEYAPQLDIKFSSIVDKTILRQLFRIAAFLEVKLTNERIRNIVALVDDYVAHQETVPWKLDINDYF